MVAGLAIDGLDLMTYGPIGLYAGLIVGGTAGYLLAPMLGFSERGRWLSALMTGIYCTVPLTGFIPAAAVAAGLSQVLLRGQERGAEEIPSEQDPALRPEGSIEADYEVTDEK
jgi:hypothetical protein